MISPDNTNCSPENVSRCIVEVWKPTLSADHIASLQKNHSIIHSISPELTADLQRIVEIEQASFPDTVAWGIWEARGYFIDNLHSTIVILREPNSKKIVGYTVAMPAYMEYPMYREYANRQVDDKTAYIVNTAIDPAFRGQKYVQELQNILEVELRKKGFQFLERDAADYPDGNQQTYAQNIIQNKQDTLVFAEPHDSSLGQQMYIRTRL